MQSANLNLINLMKKNKKKFMNESIKLELGAMCDPISKQLSDFLEINELELFDKIQDGLILCRIYGIINESEYAKGQQRLLKKIKLKIANSNE